ncbi:MAG: methyltransferase domain-containing protein [Hyphomicrobiales bacterium]
MAKNRIIHDGVNIVLGAHCDPSEDLEFPPNTVIFNSEILKAENGWRSAEYQKIIENSYVWDYSPSNMEFIPHGNKSLVRLCHEPKLNRLGKSTPKSIDLLFYGSMNDRRHEQFRALSATDLNVYSAYGVYARERDELIEQAKAVLNSHYFDEEIFQQVRCFYPLINGVPVISENWSEGSAPEFYEDAIFTPGDMPMTAYISELLADTKRFEAESAVKIKAFSDSAAADNFEETVKRTLSHFKSEGSLSKTASRKASFTKINLGSGQDYRTDCLNIDVEECTQPDIVFDLSQPLEFPVKVKSERLGKIVLEKDGFDVIIANNVLEQVPDLTALMENCLKLLKVGGELNISAPYDLSLGAWQNPANIRAFNQNSWFDFTDRFWNMGWFDHRFSLAKMQYQLSELGKELHASGMATDKLANQPRAVDSMTVILVKQETTPVERTLARSNMPSF